ncbi:MAG: cytochrome b N-terminal domain-containing protein [Deltaproteobacteria bacterium]
MKSFYSFFQKTQWGSKSFVMLCVSIFSGIIVALQYESANPFYSSISLDLLVPFGAFWRSLHFYSSQLFFFLAVAHFSVIAAEMRQNVPFSKWLFLCLSLPVSLLLLFTGYILRGDATGQAAGYIAENIARSIPLVGNLINHFLFAVSEVGLRKVLANHLAGLVFLWLFLSWDHIRRYKVEWWKNGPELVVLLLFCSLVRAPMEIHGPGASLISGPWFFLGMQEMLRTVPPLLAGVLFPASLVVATFFLCRPAWRRPASLYILCWLFGYGILTVIALMRVGI